MRPTFPLRIRAVGGREEVVANEEELARSLEWFDSTQSDGTVSVIDAHGRPVVLLIEALKIKVLEVHEGA